MKILFVSSGNKGRVSIILQNQAESLKLYDIDVDFFLIKGKGVAGYLKNVISLKKTLHKGKYDIIHAHYSFSAFAASLAGAKPLVVSLMGSDVKADRLRLFLIRLFSGLFKWKSIIVKSIDMKTVLKLKSTKVIPNGIDVIRFKENDKAAAQRKLSWHPQKKHILFAADPDVTAKNYSLARDALGQIRNANLELHVLKNINHYDLPIWYNASDVVILTSLWEGSPNVIKEALACNIPVVSTDVGDVAWLFGNIPGCYITSHDPVDVAETIKMALKFSEKYQRTRSRERLSSLGLDSESIAKRIMAVYQSVLDRNAQ